MTERSYLWDGVVTGDASIAPYTAQEFLKYFSLTRSDNNQGVIPGYLGSLEPSFAGSSLAAVYVKAGAAIVDGRLYVLDEDTTVRISVPAAELGWRLDYLVLRVSGSQVRLTVVEGNPELLTPVVPAINESDVPIAVVYVTTQVADGYVYDRRPFLTNMYSDSIESHNNLIKNSDFSVYTPAAGDPPEWWAESGIFAASYPAKGTVAPLFYGGTRGRYVALSPNPTGAGEIGVAGVEAGIYQTIQAGGGKVFTLKGDIQLEAVGDEAFPTTLTVSLTGFDQYGSLVGYRQEAYVQRVEAENANFFPYRFTTEFKEEISFLSVSFTAASITTGAEGFVGQVVLTAGYNTGKIIEEQELIIHRNFVADANWNVTAKSDATTTIDLDTDFGGNIAAGNYAVMLRITIRDSTSNIGVCKIRILTMDGVDVGGVYLTNEPNDANRSGNILVPIDEARQFQIAVDATGAGTLDATVVIVGTLL